jgi:uncharacterized membrane protein (UPF0127 family)
MLKVEIANTPSKHEKGLMFVENLPQDEGMLFIFQRPHKLAFWGRNTFIPLDIAFIDRDNKIQKIGSIKPFDLSKVASDTDCVMALEVNAGYFQNQNIAVGDEINIDTDDWMKTASVSFRTKEGKSSEKANVKHSQTINHQVPIHEPAPPGMPTQPPKVEGEENLPVLDANDLQKILEDSFDEPELPPQQEEMPPEQPQPQVEPQKKYPTFDNVFDAAKWAEDNNEVMRINYETRSGRQITRDVEPHGQFHADSTMHQILVCFDETVNDIRAFILTNVRNWSFLHKEFQKKFIVRA